MVYGCKQCQRDFDHQPITITLPGIPARTYFFCSTPCRERWWGGSEQETEQPPSRCVAVDPVDGVGTDGLRAQILHLQTQLSTQAAHLERVHQENEELHARIALLDPDAAREFVNAHLSPPPDGSSDR